MPSSDPQKRFGDIIYNIDAIAGYTQGMSEEDFFSNHLIYDASERCLSRISEAATKLGLLAEELAPDQPWSDIRGIGNWLRHDYPNIVKQTIWQTITEHLPPLRLSCEAAIAKLQSKS